MQKTRNAKTQTGEGARGLESFPESGSGASAVSRGLSLFRRGNVALPGLLLFGLVVWVFLPALRGDFIEFDDNVYVTANAHVTSGLTLQNMAWAFSHTVVGVWHPLTFWSHMLDCQLYGLKPWGHHLTSVLLHALNAVLVFLVLRQITGATWRSLLVAGLFGLHPLRVESVAWICERKDGLSLMFWLLTISAYAKYVVASKTHSPQSKGWYGLTLVLFACGLMSKPMVVTLPFVLVLLDYWPLRRFELSTLNTQRSTGLRLVLEKAPFFILSAVLCAFVFILGKASGVMDFLPDLSLGARLGNALISYGRYLGKLIWPANLCAHYLHPGHWPLGQVLLAGLLLSGISGYVLAMRRQRPYLLVGWLWYLGALVPVIGLVQVCTLSMADRYLYIPGLGVLVALAWGACELTARWRHQGISLCAVGSAVALSCIALTRHQIGYWKDGITLWSHAVAVEMDNYDAHNRLGRALFSKGRVNEAILEFQEAARLKPGYVEAQCGLGNAFLMTKRWDEAILHYLKALEIEPALEKIQNNVGFVFLQKGQMEAALAHFQKALELQPDFAPAHNNLGNALLVTGQLDEAILHFQKALESNPGFVEAQHSLGSALVKKGRVDEAIPHLRRASEIQPNSAQAHNDLGYALLLKGRVDEAVAEFQAAVSSKPDYLQASNNLVTALSIKETLARQPAQSPKP